MAPTFSTCSATMYIPPKLISTVWVFFSFFRRSKTLSISFWSSITRYFTVILRERRGWALFSMNILASGIGKSSLQNPVTHRHGEKNSAIRLVGRPNDKGVERKVSSLPFHRQLLVHLNRQPNRGIKKFQGVLPI